MAIESEILLEPPSSVDEKSLNNALDFIEEMTKNTDSNQERVLAEILAQNAETEYLNRFGLNGATDRETFKSKVAVITYEDLIPDIQRIAKGDTSPILYMCSSNLRISDQVFSLSLEYISFQQLYCFHTTLIF